MSTLARSLHLTPLAERVFDKAVHHSLGRSSGEKGEIEDAWTPPGCTQPFVPTDPPGRHAMPRPTCHGTVTLRLPETPSLVAVKIAVPAALIFSMALWPNTSPISMTLELLTDQLTSLP